MGRPATPAIDRFMAKALPEPNSGCWLWEGHCLPSGYGLFRSTTNSRDLHTLAHRFSYSHFHADIPSDQEVLHSCDNPSCVNPDHLSIGTHADNMQDAKSKGRHAFGDRHGRRKITSEDVVKIRDMKMPQRAIGAIMGISQSQVSQIRAHKRWAI